MPRITRRSALALLASSGLALAARPSFAADDYKDYLDGLYKAAKDAGETDVFIYASASRDNLPIYDVFMKQYPGIAVKSTDLFGAPLLARLQAEHAASGPQADLLITAVADQLNFKREGFTQSFVPKTAEKLPEKHFGSDKLWIEHATLVLGPVVNANLIKGDDVPKSWQDLVGPMFQGKIAMTNPGLISGLAICFKALEAAKVVDTEWMKKLAAGKPRFTQGAVQAVQMVASGQASLFPIESFSSYRLYSSQGAPLTYCYLKEGMAAISTPCAMTAKAPHPNAAKLLMAWIFSPEGQTQIAATGRHPVLPGMPKAKGLPEDFKLPLHSLHWTGFEDFPEYLKRNKEIFGT